MKEEKEQRDIRTLPPPPKTKSTAMNDTIHIQQHPVDNTTAIQMSEEVQELTVVFHDNECKVKQITVKMKNNTSKI